MHGVVFPLAQGFSTPRKAGSLQLGPPLRLIPSSQKCHKLRQLLGEFSGIPLQVKLLRQRKWFSQPALAANSSSLLSFMVAYICFTIALVILRDALLWRACLLITHSHMFISSSSLAFFLPPPGSLALLLSSSYRCWSSLSLTLLWSTEKRLAASSPEFFSAYFTTESLNCHTLYFFDAPEPCRSSMWYWLTESKHNVKKAKKKTCSVSGHVFFLDLK